ncbi:MAG: hypothetical protein M1829_003313 [Trizodia sp. TS-e1964]|nr:MAG: hypothetical protein M1829_003313 [Trizodia sp. TS-e1964]
MDIDPKTLFPSERHYFYLREIRSGFIGVLITGKYPSPLIILGRPREEVWMDQDVWQKLKKLIIQLKTYKSEFDYLSLMINTLNKQRLTFLACLRRSTSPSPEELNNLDGKMDAPIRYLARQTDGQQKFTPDHVGALWKLVTDVKQVLDCIDSLGTLAHAMLVDTAEAEEEQVEGPVEEPGSTTPKHSSTGVPSAMPVTSEEATLTATVSPPTPAKVKAKKAEVFDKSPPEWKVRGLASQYIDNEFAVLPTGVEAWKQLIDEQYSWNLMCNAPMRATVVKMYILLLEAREIVADLHAIALDTHEKGVAVEKSHKKWYPAMEAYAKRFAPSEPIDEPMTSAF